MDIKFKVPDGMDYIMINVTALGKEYQLPAVKTQEQKLFRIPHKVLSKLFEDMKRNNRDLKIDNGVIDGLVVGTMSPKHCVAACRISHGSNIGEICYGETNVTIDSSQSEKEAPFVSAVNRAKDKAILKFIGLESQYFDENGTPALYSADVEAKRVEPGTDRKVITKGNEPTAEKAVNEAANAQDEPADMETPENKQAAGNETPTIEQTPDANAQTPAAEKAVDNADEVLWDPTVPFRVAENPLTAKEEKEYESLCRQTLKLRKGGQDMIIALSDMQEATLLYLAKCGNEAYANLAGRYLELRDKKNGAA